PRPSLSDQICQDPSPNKRSCNMGQNVTKKSTTVIVAELRELLGPSPVLSTENQRSYDEISARLIECYLPVDIMEQMLIRQLIDASWEIVRYTRHKKLALDRKLREQREFQVKRAQELTKLREEKARERAERNAKTATQSDRVRELVDTVDGSIQDVDEILNRPPVGLDHARALEGALDYLERLDADISVFIARRNNALELLSLYRDGVGARLRDASAKIIDVENRLVEPEPPQLAGPAQEPSSEAMQIAGTEASSSNGVHVQNRQPKPAGEAVPVGKSQTSPDDGAQGAGPMQEPTGEVMPISAPQEVSGDGAQTPGRAGEP